MLVGRGLDDGVLSSAGRARDTGVLRPDEPGVRSEDDRVDMELKVAGNAWCFDRGSRETRKLCSSSVGEELEESKRGSREEAAEKRLADEWTGGERCKLLASRPVGLASSISTSTEPNLAALRVRTLRNLFKLLVSRGFTSRWE